MQATALFTHPPALKRRTRRQTIHTTLHLKPGARAELERVAGLRQLSISATGAALVEWALQQDLESQHGALFEAVMTRLMRERERVFDNRFAALFTRFAVEMGQVRQLVTNLLPAVPGMTEEHAYNIIEEAYSRSKRNLARRYPELEGIIDDLSKWLRNEEEAEEERGGEYGSGK
jgi:hypothetical protein